MNKLERARVKQIERVSSSGEIHVQTAHLLAITGSRLDYPRREN